MGKEKKPLKEKKQEVPGTMNKSFEDGGDENPMPEGPPIKK